MSLMTGTNVNGAAAHFGRQMRNERQLRGWTIAEMAKHMGADAAHLSRVENGKRPPTEKLAELCDRVFPERRRWFAEYYQESRTWMPPGFRDWPEVENNAARLSVWSPSIIDGLLQTEDYAAALLATLPGATAEAVTTRRVNRMERQRRVLMRDDPPAAWFVVDHTALYRLAGSAELMAGQMNRLAEVAGLPHVTIQVLPAIAHPATQSSFMVTGSAAYAEHVGGGYVYTDTETVTRFDRLFDTLRGECYRVSESLAIIRKAGELWTGESQASAEPTGASA
jgi:transcriptional regulator with XRE-family HTH domain